MKYNISQNDVIHSNNEIDKRINVIKIANSTTAGLLLSARQKQKQRDSHSRAQQERGRKQPAPENIL